MFLFNFFGFLFFIAMGSEQIDAYKHAPYVSFRHSALLLRILIFYQLLISGSFKGSGNGFDGNSDELCVSCRHSL